MKAIADTIWQVSALNFEIKTMLERGVGTVWIEGEVSNFSCPASGHWYFSLKDENAQLRAAMFRNRNQRAGFTPSNGQKILVRAQVTLYQARGEFQVVVDHLEEAGVGRLMREFEALKRSLAAQGLFDPAHKQAIPRAAQRIGIVTSPTGAALRDALSVIRRKSPGSEVTLFASAVQGEQAAQGIVDAIELANRDASCEVILLIRGGGSLEDLWCFNQETVARAIFESKIPVVCGVGHEIDTTIADLVADARAPTPSVAAESVTLDQYEQMARIDQLALRLRQTWGRRLDSAAQALANAQRRLSNMHPERQLAALHQRLDFSRKTLRQIPLQRISAMQQQQRLLHNRLIAQNPTRQVDALNNQLEKRALQMRQVMQQCLQTERHALALATSRLDDLSPLRTLARGYAIVSDPQGSVIRSAAALEPGDQVDLRFEDGVRQAQIRDAEAG